jgi:hypothetical protein
MRNNSKILIVGDNPFQGISHLSQKRARERDLKIIDPEYCAGLIKLSLENGADGFMFSISDTVLAIIRVLKHKGTMPRLYAIAPAASDYVRLASRLGTPGLANYLLWQIVASGNYQAILHGINGIITRSPSSLMKAYIFYELSRIKSATSHSAKPYSFLLHELVTEMGLVLNLEWLFKEYIEFLLQVNIKPGFETRNSSMLIGRFLKWGIDLKQVVIVAPFNPIGFQMCPSRKECEKALDKTPDTEVIGMSVLAGGYLKIQDTTEYIKGIPQLQGIVVGVSTEQQSRDLKIFKEAIG